MGKTLCIIGHRPAKLYGYQDREPYNDLLARIQADLRTLYDYDFDHFILNGGQGASQLAFWAIEGLRREGLDLHTQIMIPYKGWQSRWNETGLFSQTEYNQMLSCAEKTWLLADMAPADKEQALQAAYIADCRMIDFAHTVYAVYQGTQENCRTDKSGTAKALRYARTSKKEILLIMPHRPAAEEKTAAV